MEGSRVITRTLTELVTKFVTVGGNGYGFKPHFWFAAVKEKIFSIRNGTD